MQDEWIDPHAKGNKITEKDPLPNKYEQQNVNRPEYEQATKISVTRDLTYVTVMYGRGDWT